MEILCKTNEEVDLPIAPSSAFQVETLEAYLRWKARGLQPFDIPLPVDSATAGPCGPTDAGKTGDVEGETLVHQEVGRHSRTSLVPGGRRDGCTQVKALRVKSGSARPGCKQVPSVNCEVVTSSQMTDHLEAGVKPRGDHCGQHSNRDVAHKPRRETSCATPATRRAASTPAKTSPSRGSDWQVVSGKKQHPSAARWRLANLVADDQARAYAARQKEIKLEEMAAAAATVIQSCFRGFLVRTRDGHGELASSAAALKGPCTPDKSAQVHVHVKKGKGSSHSKSMKKALATEEAKLVEDAIAKADLERDELEKFYAADLRQLARLRDRDGGPLRCQNRHSFSSGLSTTGEICLVCGEGLMNKPSLQCTARKCRSSLCHACCLRTSMFVDDEIGEDGDNAVGQAPPFGNMGGNALVQSPLFGNGGSAALVQSPPFGNVGDNALR
jgi:hypothetical protein